MADFIDPTLRIAHNDLSQAEGFALSAIMCNEIYFLPKFLDHYRNLGVKRFFLLDDQSTDGSREFAVSQADVMLLESDHRYGSMLTTKSGKNNRAMLAWRNTILQKYASDQWHLHLDLDEFIDLPEGQSFDGFVKNFPHHNAIWAAMIDLYPQTWAEVTHNPNQPIDEID